MIFFLITVFFFSITAYSAEISEHFLKIKQHIKNCPITCTSSLCATKDTKILDEYYKERYGDVYRTYHCISEIDAQKHGLNQEFRYFINFYGQLLVSKKSATVKDDLILFRREQGYEHDSRDIDNKLKRLFDKKRSEKLSALCPPNFDIVRTPSKNQSQKRDGDFATDLYCCASECPTEVINLIRDYMLKLSQDTYLYYFSDTKGADTYIADDKKFLFCMVNVTEMIENIKHRQKDYGNILVHDYRYCLINHKFKIATLYTDIDLYSNGGKRIVMLGEYEEKKGWLFSQPQKYTVLMHIPERSEGRRCLENSSRGEFFCVKAYTIDDLKKNHTQLLDAKQGSWNDELPLNCYHPQIITGSIKEITDYLRSAVKRIALGTSCLHKNEAVSSDECEVYNNPFGEFVIKKDGKRRVVPGFFYNRYNLYRAVHNNDDVNDDQKMMQRAKSYAQQWKKTADNKFLYWWEESPQGTCTKVWPYGVECSWAGRYGYIRFDGYKKFYSWFDADKELRNIESFGKYRLWILPLSQLKEAIKKRDISLTFCMLYADFPYNVIPQSDDILNLEHDQSDYTVYVDLKRRNGDGDRYARVDFPDQRLVDYRGNPLDEQYKNQKTCLRLIYSYKDPVKLQEFQQRRQERDDAKIRAEHAKEEAKQNEELIKMGLLTDPNRKDQADVSVNNAVQPFVLAGPIIHPTHNGKKGPWFFSSFRQHVSMIIGSVALGGAIGGLWWFLHKQPAINLKLPAPTV